MRIVAALFKHETNTFSPIRTRWNSFGDGGPLEGLGAINACRGTAQPIAAYIEFADSKEAVLHVPLAGRATPSGPVERQAFEWASDRLVRSVRQGCDAVLLDLHGAMVVDGIDDGDGELVERIKSVAAGAPIGVALDFHANVSSRLARGATVLVGYKTYPHIDMYETGQAVARLVDRIMTGNRAPALSAVSVPLLCHTLCQNTAREPMRSIMAMARRAESEGEAASVSVLGGFYSADVAQSGPSVIAVCFDGPDRARAVAEKIAAEVWRKRCDLVYEPEPLAVSVARAKGATRGPVVLADHCDNPSAGGTQDTMHLIREVLRQGLENVAVASVCDPDAVAQLIDAGEGAQATVAVGGKVDIPAMQHRGSPLTLSGRVSAIADGRYVIDGPVFTGMRVNMGRTVRFTVGAVDLVLTERRGEPFDLNIFRIVGIEARNKRYLVLKSKMHFRAAYEPIATEIIECNGFGAGTSDFSLLSYHKVRRPIYPLDLEVSYP